MRLTVRVIGRIDVAEAIASALRGAGVDADVVNAGPMTAITSAPTPHDGADVVLVTSLFDPPLWRLGKARNPLRPMVAVAEPRRERFLRGLVTRRHGPDAYVTWPATEMELTAALQRASASAGPLRRWSWLDAADAVVGLGFPIWVLAPSLGLGHWGNAVSVSALLLAGLGLLVRAPYSWNVWWQVFAGVATMALGIALVATDGYAS